MNTPPPAPELVDINCPICQQRGKLPTSFRGQWVRCRRCGESFQAPRPRTRLGTCRPEADFEKAEPVARGPSLGVAWPAADEGTSPPLRVFAG
jgi:hypothetical protein